MTSILKLIGNTPLIELKKLIPSNGARIFMKLEYMNPTGSHKDRIAWYMIKDAEERGMLTKDRPVIEASSGNTAISVAWVSSLLGYKSIIVVPEGTSPSKIAVIKSLGAEIVIAPNVPPDHPKYYKNLARELARERNGVFLNQYENKANIRAHYETTAREIWMQTNGDLDAFVMCVGTSGTLMGVAKFLRERKKDVKIVAVTTKGSPIAGGTKGEHIEGMAWLEKPKLYNSELVDEVIEVSAKEALDYMKELIRKEGILAGHSSGANIAAAVKVAEKLGRNKKVVTIAADNALRYIHLLTEE